MVNVDRLLGVNGDARKLLGLPHRGTVAWSNPEDLARYEVIKGVHFDDFALSNAEIGINFVGCSFDRCAFKDLKTRGHLWGAEDRWFQCVFKRCDLRGMIAPVNSFKGCFFEEVTIEKFKPHQTLFDDCSFSHGSIQGIKVQMISNSQVVNREFKSGGGHLLFRNCRFDTMAFGQCYFDGVVFQRCIFEKTTASACNFDGVVSDVHWWEMRQSDPFMVFLVNALDLIGSKCGLSSSAYREFESYLIDYGSGRTTSTDFSACLFNDRVPYEETQKFINGLRELTSRFPF